MFYEWKLLEYSIFIDFFKSLKHQRILFNEFE